MEQEFSSEQAAVECIIMMDLLCNIVSMLFLSLIQQQYIDMTHN